MERQNNIENRKLYIISTNINTNHSIIVEDTVVELYKINVSNVSSMFKSDMKP